MNNFWLKSPSDIFFGSGQIKVISRFISCFGPRVLIVYGCGSLKKYGWHDKIVSVLKSAGAEISELENVSANPDISKVRVGAEICKNKNIQWILAAGGGSVIDTAKAVASARYFNKDPLEIFEKRRSVKKALPIGVFLTTSATGSESSPGMVICDKKSRKKYSFGSMKVIPRFAVMNPEVTFSLSRRQTAAGAVDIMSHILEHYFYSDEETFLQKNIAESVLRTVFKYAPEACENPCDYNARSALMLASSLALNDYSGAGGKYDWGVHMIEHAVSGCCETSHGEGLAVLIPHWMEYVISEKSNPEIFLSYAENIWNIKGTGFGNKKEIAEKAAERTRSFFNFMGLPSRFKELGISEDDMEEIAENAVSSRGYAGNIIKLQKKEVLSLIKNAW